MKTTLRKYFESATELMDNGELHLEMGIYIKGNDPEQLETVWEALNEELKEIDSDYEMTGEWEIDEVKEGIYELGDYTIVEYEKGDRQYHIDRFNEVYKSFKKEIFS